MLFLNQALTSENLKKIIGFINFTIKQNPKIITIAICDDEGLPIVASINDPEKTVLLSAITAAIKSVASQYARYFTMTEFDRIIIDYKDSGILIKEVAPGYYLFAYFKKPLPLGLLLRDVTHLITKIRVAIGL